MVKLLVHTSLHMPYITECKEPMTTYQAVLFAVVQPVTSSPSANDPLQLVCLDPNDLITSLVPEMIVTCATLSAS